MPERLVVPELALLRNEALFHLVAKELRILYLSHILHGLLDRDVAKSLGLVLSKLSGLIGHRIVYFWCCKS